MSKFWSWDSTVPTAKCHASLVFLAPSRGHGTSPTRIQGRFLVSSRYLFNISNSAIEQPGMLIPRTICQVSLVGCTNDCHNCRSGRKLIFRIPPPIASVRHTGYSAVFRVGEPHQFKIKVPLQWEMFKKELNTFENILVL